MRADIAVADIGAAHREVTGSEAAENEASRPLARSLRRGLRCRCPSCGDGRLFFRYLKTAPECPTCGEDLSHHRADDAPPYFTIVIVGHLVVPIMLAVQMETDLSNLTHLAIWLPLTALLAILLLQPVKGAVVGMQWALRMHGFDGRQDSDSIDPVWDISTPEPKTSA